MNGAKEELKRFKTILKTSVIGIIVNAIIASLKVAIGLIAGSISILSDGINNFTDAGSSVVTIVGTALSNKPANKKHPFGYGRIEYLSSLGVAIIILYAGITVLIESIKGIINNEPPSYNIVMLIIIGVSVIFKLALSIYTRKVGKKVESDALISSGTDAFFDVFISLSTLLAAIIYMTTNVSLESYLGIIISIFILKAGIEALLQTASKIIGVPVQYKLAKDITNTIKEMEDVLGVFDLIVNNYGHNKYIASVHIEVDENLKASEIDKITRLITETVYKKHGVYLSAIGIYSKNRSNNIYSEMEENIKNIVLENKYVKSMHGFYIDDEQKYIRFDLVISLDSKNRNEVYYRAIEKVKRTYPDYKYLVGLDTDYSEIDD